MYAPPHSSRGGIERIGIAAITGRKDTSIHDGGRTVDGAWKCKRPENTQIRNIGGTEQRLVGIHAHMVRRAIVLRPPGSEVHLTVRLRGAKTSQNDDRSERAVGAPESNPESLPHWASISRAFSIFKAAKSAVSSGPN